MSITNYLVGEATPASVIAVICSDLIGEDFLSYEIETVVDLLQARVNVVIPEVNVDKIQALQTIYTTNSFYMQIPAFLAVVDAFSGNGVDFNYADMPHVEDVAWAVVETLMNVPDEDMENLFAPDVEVFIKTLLAEEGFSKAPPSLAFLGELPAKSTKDTILDDPIIFEAHHGIQQQKMADVENYVASNVMTVIRALNDLPLTNRNRESWDKFINSI